MESISDAENEARMMRGELYYAFTPRLQAARMRCFRACERFNNAGEVPRRRYVELWRDVIGDTSSLPPQAATEEEDSKFFEGEVFICPPLKVDYGTNLRVGPGVFINYNCTVLDTGIVTIGARTLIGPNCSFYAGTHPLDPFLRNGINGPELGGDINIGEDCWFGGNAIILPGVTIGRGATIGAGSVVTKDVPAFHVVAGNPARIIRKIEVHAPDPLLNPVPRRLSQDRAESPGKETKNS